MITPDANGSTAAWDWYFDKVKYDGTNEYARASIAATLGQLPEEVAAWAVEAIGFTSVGGEIWGHTLSLSAYQGLQYVIALDESILQDSNATYVVAHEIAHARLGHAAMANISAAMADEAEADRLAASWGFERKAQQQ